MAVMMFGTQGVCASTLDEKQKALEQQKAQTQKNLAAKQAEIDDLEVKKRKLEGEIEALDKDLIEVMVEIKTLKADIADKEDEIEQTKKDLAAAEEDVADQYESMKTRIQFLYEKGGTGAWAEMILADANLSNLLNKAEYTQELYDYDREALDTYTNTVEQVTELENNLEIEKSELVVMRESSEEEEKELNKKLEEKKATSANYASEIKSAEAKADAYTELIRQQSAQIRQIQQQKEEEARRAAEEARKKAAQEAARKAAEQERQRQAAARSNGTSSGSSSGSSSGGSSGGSSGSSSGSSSGGSTSSGGSVGYSGKGSSVVSYATQFVGNPYVWGGTSLTNGADCSGFIMSVYAKFGVSLPHSSSALRGVGTGVSYSEAKPGDIICYSGHCAIYMGNGAIVHASNKKEGIKISYNAAYRTILAVRRIFT